MAIEEIHVGDIGTAFELVIHDTVGSVPSILDISAATAKQITFLKGDGTSLVVQAQFKTDGTDGIIQYTTISGDLSVSGPWELQGKVSLPFGSWNTDISKFRVYDNLV